MVSGRPLGVVALRSVATTTGHEFAFDDSSLRLAQNTKYKIQYMNNEDTETQKAELAGLNRLNGAIEKVINALDSAARNTEDVNETVQDADRLLNLWIRVLARSEQSQRLILDEEWGGASSDLQAIEAETSLASRRAEQAREQQAQRARIAAEQERMEEIARAEAIARTASSDVAAEAKPINRTGSSNKKSMTTTTATATTRTRTSTGPKKEPVSAYAQRRVPSSSGASSGAGTGPGTGTGTRSTSASSDTTPIGGTGRGSGRGRGVPVVRGTRASKGREQGIGRAGSGKTLDPGFR